MNEKSIASVHTPDQLIENQPLSQLIDRSDLFRDSLATNPTLWFAT